MNEKTPISYGKSYSYLFEDGDIEIEVWCSFISGLERVYVNRQLVSEQRSYSKNSSHLFTIGENEYSINLMVKSILRGPFICTLYKNKKAYKRQKLVIIKIRDLLNVKFIVMAITLVIITAALINIAGLPRLLAIFIILLSPLLLFNKHVLPVAWIENDKIV